MWEVVSETTYPEWYDFDGDYTQLVAKFQTGPEQLTWFLTDPIGEMIANSIRSKAMESGATPLYYRLMKNTEDTWTTEWQIDLWASQNSPLHIGIGAWIIIGAITALGIAYLTMKIISEIQATKRTKIAKESEQIKSDFVAKYEPIYGAKVFDWVKNIATVPADVAADKSLMDELKDVAKPAITIGAIVAIGALIFFGMQYLPKPRKVVAA